VTATHRFLFLLGLFYYNTLCIVEQFRITLGRESSEDG